MVVWRSAPGVPGIMAKITLPVHSAISARARVSDAIGGSQEPEEAGEAGAEVEDAAGYEGGKGGGQQ